MILLWGTLDDAPMASAHAALLRAGADVCFLDYSKVFTADIECELEPHGSWRCTVTSDGAVIDMARVGVAYVRGGNFYDFDEMDGQPADGPLALRAATFEAELKAWLDSCDALVINKSGPAATNNSKPYQMAAIAAAGFTVPETLLTNDVPAARRFLSSDESVFKSISGVRSIVRRVTGAHRIDDVEWCPTLFQRLVRGTNYRAHVLGEDVFAVRVESNELDYRYGDSSMRAAKLPDGVARRCRRLNAALGLAFSGIDLMVTPHGEWYCFEVNTSPAYTYFEALSGQPIAAALARFMLAADAS